MTTVTTLTDMMADKQGIPERSLKPIEFLFFLDADHCKAPASYYPSDYNMIILIEEAYMKSPYDLMYAINNNKGVLYIGRYNDGVTQ